MLILRCTVFGVVRSVWGRLRALNSVNLTIWFMNIKQSISLLYSALGESKKKKKLETGRRSTLFGHFLALDVTLTVV